MSDTAFLNDLPPTIPAALDRAAQLHSAREALAESEIRLTWSELREEADAVSRGLVAAGVGAGDSVAIWAPNAPEWVIAALGVHRIGARLVTVNTRFKGAEAAYVLKAAKVRLLFTVTDFLDTDYVALLRAAEEPLPDLARIVVLRGPARKDTNGFAKFLEAGEAVAPATTQALADAVTPDVISDVIFTSGTTGAPKGAMLTHSSSLKAIGAWNHLLGIEATDRYLVMNPFFHTFGLKGGILSCVLSGAAIVPHAVFDVPSILAKIAAEKITVFPGPPAIYQTMLDHPDLNRHDTSTLRLAVTGAAAVPVEMINRMRNEMTFRTIVTAYGLTEATGLVTLCRQEDDPRTIAETAGRPLPGVELRVADEQGHEVPQGEPGEILVRGYNLMQGYFGDAAATAAAIDADGFLHTGDIGLQDAAGNVRITDRKKDMFIVGGFNAYPAEIENMIMQHPAISQVAVIGVPDHRMGEVGMAYVVLRPDQALTAGELETWCRSRMANYKVPRRFAFVDSFPLNATGKVLKFRLRETAVTA